MALPLALLLRSLDTIAPLSLAEAWDNVGLLVDPRARDEELQVERVLLTIDATPAVLREASELNAQCLVAYHPPIFRPLKRVSRHGEPALFQAIRAGFAVYSPHTALDAAPAGLNDWLAEAFGEAEVTPIEPACRVELGAELKLVVFVPKQDADRLRDALAEAGAGVIGNYSHCSFNLDGEGTFLGSEVAKPVVGQVGKLERVPEVRLEVVFSKRDFGRVARAIQSHHPYEEPAWDVYPLLPKPHPGAGAGRTVTLATPRPLGELLDAIKRHLGLTQLRLAATEAHLQGTLLRRVAVSAGSGASLIDRLEDAELYLTGELGHHDVLRALRNGTSVVLCEHSSSERGYLARLRDRLLAETGGSVEVVVARTDSEPLRIV